MKSNAYSKSVCSSIGTLTWPFEALIKQQNKTVLAQQPEWNVGVVWFRRPVGEAGCLSRSAEYGRASWVCVNLSKVCPRQPCSISHWMATSVAGRGHRAASLTETDWPSSTRQKKTMIICSSISCFISVCPCVALLKATYAEDSHIVLSSRY